MRLEQISLRDFRGVTGADVAFAPAGVTIVEGPNEVGKSTIPLAIDLLFDYPDSSRDHRVLDSQPVGRDAGPYVRAVFETGGYRVDYRKRFVRQPFTEVAVTGRATERHTGREAHARVEQILAETMDRGLWKALRIEQGTSLGQPAFDDATALGAALDEAAAASPAGESDNLFTSAQAEYQRYLTPRTGKPTSDYRDAMAAEAAARERSADLVAQAAAVDADVARVAAIEVELTELGRQGREADAAAAALRGRAERLATAEHELDTARYQLDTARLAGRQAEERAADRAALVGAVEAAEAEVADLRERLRDAAENADALREQADRAAAVAESAEEAARAAELAARLAGDDHELAREQGELSRLRTVRDQVDAVRSQLSDTVSRLSGLRVDDATLSSIEAAHAALREATAAREAGAARLRVEPLGAVPVTIDGTDVTAVADRALAGRMVVEAAGAVRVTVLPSRSEAELSAAVVAAERMVAARLSAAGVGTVPGAREQATERQRLDAERALQQQRIDGLLDGTSAEQLADRVAVLTGVVRALEERRPVDRPRPATVDEARAAADRSRSTADDARVRADAAARTAREAGDRANDAGTARARLHQRVDDRAAEHARLAGQLAHARAEADDAALTAAAGQARATVADAERRVAGAAAAVAELHPDTLAILVANAEQLSGRLAADVRTLEDERLAILARLEAAGSAGLADRCARAAAELVAAERHAESVTRRAEAARLLFETLAEHRDAAHRRYREPYRAAVAKLGRVVFGDGFDVELSDQLAIRARTLAGTAVPFEQLSSGAKEQLGLICRLSCAELVGAAGAPVVVDDALGYSDPERLARVCAVLGHAGRFGQVIVLTCQPERFRAVGSAAVVRLRPAAGAGLREPGAGDPAGVAAARPVPAAAGVAPLALARVAAGFGSLAAAGSGSPAVTLAEPAVPAARPAGGRLGPTSAAGRILQVLRAAGRPLGKAAILTDAGVSAHDWSWAVDQLVSGGLVRRSGRKRGTVYEAVDPPGTSAVPAVG